MSDRDGGELGGVTIGAREIYDQLVAMREDVRSLAQSHEATDKALEDHSGRIRSVERWVWSAPASLLTGIASAVIVLTR